MVNSFFAKNSLMAMLISSLLAVFIGIGSVMPSTAQTAQTSMPVDPANTAPMAPSPNDVRELLRLLADPSIRHWLAEGGASQGKAAEPETAPLGIREQFAGVTEAVHKRIAELSNLWTDIPKAGNMLTSVWMNQLSETEILRLVTYSLIFLFTGAALEWLYFQYTKYRLMQIEFLQPSSFRSKWKAVFTRICLSVGSLFFFLSGSIGAFLMFDWPDTIRTIMLDFLIMIVSLRLVFLISKIVFAPRMKNLRLVDFSTNQARLAHRWFVALLSFGAFVAFVQRLFSQTLQMMQDGGTSGAALSVEILNAVIWAVLAFAAIWYLKDQFIDKNVQASGLRGRLANTWPTYLTVLLGLVLALYIMGATPLTGTVVIIGLLIPAIALAGRWIDSLFDQAANIPRQMFSSIEPKTLQDGSPLAEATEEAEQGDISVIQPFQIYRSIIKRLARFALVAVAILLLVNHWGINLFALSSSQTMAGRVFDIAVDTLFVLLLADLVWHWGKSAIDRRLADYTPPADGQSPGPEARMATLLPMLRMMLMVVVLMVVALSILTSFGVNVAPLLAGAGVLGVAIGFGAQALVRDVVSGVFFLIDDAFRIGEYIEIDDLRGTVESMSIRSLRVRHHRGMVHTIPFGELKSLTNYSRDWVIMKLEFRVPFETDLKLVKKIVKQIGAELLENETYGKGIIQTLKSQGVRRMEEFNMVVGVKFMAKPGEQWLIRRDAYQKVRDAFDANGIGFAERNVKVQVLSDQPLTQAKHDAVVGAAQDAIEQQMPPLPVKDEP